MNTMTMAVAMARLERDTFSPKRIKMPTTRITWPRKRFNGTVGIVKDMATGKALGKVN